MTMPSLRGRLRGTLTFSPAGDKKVQMEMGPHPELTTPLYFTSWCLLWLGYGVEDKRTEDQGEQNVTASFCHARRIKIWTERHKVNKSPRRGSRC